MQRLRIAALATVVVAAAGIAVASGKEALSSRNLTRGSDPVSGRTQAPPKSGMVVAVDPETGELGMPAPGQLGPEQSMTEVQAYARQLAAELVTLHHPDGSSTLIHDERLADYAVIRIDPDGTRQFLCVHGEHAAEGALRTSQPQSPASEER